MWVDVRRAGASGCGGHEPRALGWAMYLHWASLQAQVAATCCGVHECVRHRSSSEEGEGVLVEVFTVEHSPCTQALRSPALCESTGSKLECCSAQ